MSAPVPAQESGAAGWLAALFKGRFAWLVALTAGALAPLALAPFDYWPLSIVSVLIFFTLLRDKTPRQGFWLGYYYGVGSFGIGVSWVYHSILVYGQAPFILAAGLTAIFVLGLALIKGLLGYLACRLLNKENAWLFGFPALWVLIDAFQGWFLTGFPWLYLGYAFVETPFRGWFPLFGVHGMTLLVVLGAACIYRFFIIEDRRERVVYLNAFFLMGFLGLLLKDINWVETEGEPLTITLVQPNVTQDKKWLPEQRQITLNALRDTLAEHADSDLIVWPENAVPVFYHQAQGFLGPIDQTLTAHQQALITGLPVWLPDPEQQQGIMHNSILALGTGEGIYHKQKLVPFGEYVPLANLLRGLIGFFDLPMSSFSKGEPQQPGLLLENQQLVINPAICYEIVYSDFVRRNVGGFDLLLTISDDSWFGDSIGPWQHLQMAQARALENGRYLLRGTNTGITAFVDPSGQIYQQAEQFVAASISAEVYAMAGKTPFSRWGIWMALGFAAFMLVAALRLERC